MNIFSSIASMRTEVNHWHHHGKTIAFIPTMGNLHAGHLSLVDKAKCLADKTLVSIFVNPLQFGPTEDFATYPRTLEADQLLLEKHGVDALFCPSIEEMYPQAHHMGVQVTLPCIANDLCGKSRPGHFNGVATIVAKLFHITQPDIAIFGEKDYQQLCLIRQMVRDLNFPINIIGVPTVRETDGLAMSSRNQYLTSQERKIAPLLHTQLKWMADQIKAQSTNYDEFTELAIQSLKSYGFQVDYISIRACDTLNLPSSQDTHLAILGAARLGNTRLIDNILIHTNS